MPPKSYINDVSSVSGSAKAVKNTVTQNSLKENIHIYLSDSMTWFANCAIYNHLTNNIPIPSEHRGIAVQYSMYGHSYNMPLWGL